MGTPEGWREARLGELARRITSGGTPKVDRPDYYGGPIPFLKIDDITSSPTLRINRAKTTITELAVRETAAKVYPPGTVLVTMYGTIGAVGITTTAMAANQAIAAFMELKGCTAEYLAHSLRHEAMALASKAGQTTQANISATILRGHEVLVPPLPEQRKIAAILSSVDETIEKTGAVIDQLQVVKKAMMEELLTRGMPGRHTRFQQTEIGEIPEGWEVARLGQCVREPIRNGYSPVCPNEPTGKWTLGLGAVGHDGFNPGARKPAPLDDPRVDAALVEPGDLLVSRSNTRERVGLVGVYRDDPTPCSYPDLLMRVRTSVRLDVDFLEVAMLSVIGRTYFESRARGTSGSMVKVDRQIVEDFPLALPPVAEQREIAITLRGVDADVQANRRVLEALRTVKASLSTALLSGDLRVTPDEAPP